METVSDGLETTARDPAYTEYARNAAAQGVNAGWAETTGYAQKRFYAKGERGRIALQVTLQVVESGTTTAEIRKACDLIDSLED